MRWDDKEAVRQFLRETRNWGRWGDDDQRGALNLVTPAKRLEALQTARSGRTVSLSRNLPTEPASNNPRPVQHYSQWRPRPETTDGKRETTGAGVAVDYFGVGCHGMSVTHLDALCHTWDADGMWNGKDGTSEVGFTGTRWGGIENWKDGILTRGVLLDVPAHRGVEYVDLDNPVTGEELEDIARATGVEPRPGDALVVYCGRSGWTAEHGEWGGPPTDWKDGPAPAVGEVRPGLEASCLRPLREWDCAVLVWDMLDHSPNRAGLPWSVHSAIHAYGMALVDNADLDELVAVARDEGRAEFLFFVAPLALHGGTGSPVNPIAVF